MCFTYKPWWGLVVNKNICMSFWQCEAGCMWMGNLLHDGLVLQSFSEAS